MTDNLPARTGRTPESDDWTERERLYLALLDLAPEFRIPCRPDGNLRDISVTRHRSGPDNPWVWAIHRLGAGMASYAWDGKQWWVVDDRKRMLEHAVWPFPVPAIAEAQRIARDDEKRGHSEVEYFDD